MCTYLKNMEGKKLIDLKNKSFNSIQKMFDRAFKRVNTFVDYIIELVEESSKKSKEEVTEGSFKRAGTVLEQESVKKQKIDKETTKLQQLVKIILDEEGVVIDAIPLAVKPPSIPTKSLPCTINTKPRHEFIYKAPSIHNENDKGDVAFIEEGVIKPIPPIPNPILIKSNSLTVSPFLKDCIVLIPYMNAKMFADNVLLNTVSDKELQSYDGIETGKMKKEIKKDDKGMSEVPNKEWKLSDKMALHNKEQRSLSLPMTPTKIPRLNRIIKES
uniref:Uncharacterized protein n=1 Tax=Tanacetum cinerariifolium TaxID=118510 RepID=A0A6L2MG71_TANCI|nr:hypothetical protein [Tanacetum cinerariifolium]